MGEYNTSAQRQIETTTSTKDGNLLLCFLTTVYIQLEYIFRLVEADGCSVALLAKSLGHLSNSSCSPDCRCALHGAHFASF
eukprot:m.32181 g.32181  ORF g.32181 m.32181 type:complete len:81 (-) comp10757_c0_seq1:1562-1804(-)